MEYVESHRRGENGYYVLACMPACISHVCVCVYTQVGLCRTLVRVVRLSVSFTLPGVRDTIFRWSYGCWNIRCSKQDMT
jgi:hypothetical protein